MSIYRPISNTVPQYHASGEPASGYYLKGYRAGTTTALSMATDDTGATTLAKCALNSAGYPINGSSAVFIPHFSVDYKLALYTNSTDADADTTANAVWVVDNLSFTDADSEWVVQQHTPTRLTNTTFSLATGDGDKTAIYTPGTRLKLTDASDLTGEVLESDYNTTVVDKTHVTVKNVVNSSLVPTNLSASLSAIYTSVLSAKSHAYPSSRFNYTQFGISTDSDSTTALQRAIDNINAFGGGVLDLPAGTITHTGITMKTGVTLCGAGRSKTILLNTNNSDGVTCANVIGISLRDLTISQGGNSNSVDALTFTAVSNCEFYHLGIDTPGRYGIAFYSDGTSTGYTSGCFQNEFFKVDITGLSGTKRGIYIKKGDSYRSNANRFYGGRINNGAYAIYIDTDAGNNNEFTLTVQEQTVACVYDDSNNNSYDGIYLETTQTGAHGFQIGSSGSGMFMRPAVFTVSGGGDKVNAPAGSPVTNNTYTLISPSGNTARSRFENVDVATIRSDIGSSDEQAYPVLKPKVQYINYTTASASQETAATYTMPGNALTSTGDTIRITAWGTTTSSATAKQVDVYFGAAGTRNVASITSSTGSVLPWKVETIIQRTGASTQSAYYTCVMGQGTSFNTVAQGTTAPNQDLTADVTITVALTAAGGAGVMTMNGWIVEAL